MIIGKEKAERIDTIIGDQVYFEGTISAKQGLRIDGSVKGKVHCEGTLVIGSKGKVAAETVADNVLIAGEFSGNITAKNRLEITEKGKVYGDITTANLVMAPGVIFNGKCNMSSEQVLLKPADSLSLPAPLRHSLSHGTS
ncbi:MAG: polymer-forming cytoskeletal protein [Desulfobacteraceae bacterium]|nr:MAG: polymer-forming cytoskeletal protein [Desulfobacteraceae bacterium]